MHERLSCPRSIEEGNICRTRKRIESIYTAKICFCFCLPRHFVVLVRCLIEAATAATITAVAVMLIVTWHNLCRGLTVKLHDVIRCVFVYFQLFVVSFFHENLLLSAALHGVLFLS